MTTDAHEAMTKENESQRIINQEQTQRIEAMESGLHHKAEELLVLKRQLQKLVVDNKDAHSKICQMEGAIHKAQQTWDLSVAGVSGFTEKVDTRMKQFQTDQTELLRGFSTNLSLFLENEMTAAQKSQNLLHSVLLNVDHMGMSSKTQPLKGQTEESFHELKQISKRAKELVLTNLNELSQAIYRVTEGVQDGLSKCNSQVRDLKPFKKMKLIRLVWVILQRT